MPESTAIPRIPAPDVDRFRREVADAGRPAVITGAIDHWPAMKRWSLDYFKERWGSRRLPVHVVQGRDMVLDERIGVHRRDLTVSELIDALHARDGETRYRLRAQTLDDFPGIAGDVEIPSYCRGALDLRLNSWIAGADALTPMHWDMPQNLMAQVVGTKRFVLFPPSETGRLYPYPMFSATAQFSQVNPDRPDFERFPRYRHARPMECTLGPGDMLFIPSRWWHYVESPTVTISVNFWWATWALYPFLVAGRVYKRLQGFQY